jgi:hypothetical protein
MDLNLLDPKLIVLAAVVIPIIAVLAWLYVPEYDCRPTAKVWARVPAGGA